MRLETKKYLHDVQQAVKRLAEFTRDKTFADYEADAMLRSAVERQFEIVGEALNQLAKNDPGCAASISDYRRIIAFRNILIHGYAEIDNRLVWSILETKLPALTRDVGE